MQIKIPIRALSVNKASRGRHFKTPEYKQFEKDVCLLLPFNKENVMEGELFIKYVFYLKNYKTSDEDNCKKLIQDILVKRGYLKDDRFIKASYSIKDPVERLDQERIEITVYPFSR